MSENKNLPETPAETVPALPASRDPEEEWESQAKPAPGTEQMPGEASTSDDSVARARRRRDAAPAEVQSRALDFTLRYLASMSRAPFRQVLAELIRAKPTPEAVRRFADKYPDRWAQAVSMMAGLSGFERGIIEVNVFNIKGLSDAELMAQLEQLRAAAARRPPPGPVEDAVIVEETPNG